MKLSPGAVPCINFFKNCCVPGCTSKQFDRMYNFPVYNKSNTELWIYMIRNPSLKALNIRELVRHRVCYKHFDGESFNSDKELRRTAAPTTNLPGIYFCCYLFAFCYFLALFFSSLFCLLSSYFSFILKSFNLYSLFLSLFIIFYIH